MKLILENWRKFIGEANGNFPYQIYCDMDGVLADFEVGAVEKINRDIKDKNISGGFMDKLRLALSELGRDEITKTDLSKMDKGARLQPARDYMYDVLSDDEEFWATLPWMPGGKELWSYVSKYGSYILTAPMDNKGQGSEKGKRIWIENNLNPKPGVIEMSHDKYKWAISKDGKPNILIDDFSTNTDPWNKVQKAQGLPQLAILHTDTTSTIQKLEMIGSPK
jgi:5'(3')-deoxyribonucleotidase